MCGEEGKGSIWEGVGGLMGRGGGGVGSDNSFLYVILLQVTPRGLLSKFGMHEAYCQRNEDSSNVLPQSA